MSSMRSTVRVIVTIAILASASTASALTFTCETVARKGSIDPAGATFAGKFGRARHGGPTINGSGDVVFFATPRGGPRRLYLYPGSGTPTIIAQQDGPAPGGGSFSQFEMPSTTTQPTSRSSAISRAVKASSSVPASAV